MELWGYERARRYLLEMECPPGMEVQHHLWVDWNTPRFLRTLELLPAEVTGERCLEIGAMPFTMTLLLQKMRPASELVLVDYFAGAADGEMRETAVRLPALGEEHRMRSLLRDLERQALPFADASLDGVLCCEVLEHLTQDPVAMLAEIRRVLRPSGWLMLTTPNVARLRNTLNLLHGRNVYDPYELSFGPTWRHNREYTPREVADLLGDTGFDVERVLVEDPLPPQAKRPFSERLVRLALEVVYGRHFAAQIYALARPGPVAKRTYSSWLFQHGTAEGSAMG